MALTGFDQTGHGLAGFVDEWRLKSASMGTDPRMLTCLQQVLNAVSPERGYVLSFIPEGTADTSYTDRKVRVTSSILRDIDRKVRTAEGGFRLTAGAVCHEVSHIRYGQHTSAAVKAKYGDRKDKGLAWALHNILDDIRIEQRFLRDFPGFGEVFPDLIAWVAQLPPGQTRIEQVTNRAEALTAFINGARFEHHTFWNENDPVVVSARTVAHDWAIEYTKDDTVETHLKGVAAAIAFVRTFPKTPEEEPPPTTDEGGQSESQPDGQPEPGQDDVDEPVPGTHNVDPDADDDAEGGEPQSGGCTCGCGCVESALGATAPHTCDKCGHILTLDPDGDQKGTGKGRGEQESDDTSDEGESDDDTTEDEDGQSKGSGSDESEDEDESESEGSGEDDTDEPGEDNDPSSSGTGQGSESDHDDDEETLDQSDIDAANQKDVDDIIAADDTFENQESEKALEEARDKVTFSEGGALPDHTPVYHEQRRGGWRSQVGAFDPVAAQGVAEAFDSTRLSFETYGPGFQSGRFRGTSACRAATGSLNVMYRRSLPSKTRIHLALLIDWSRSMESGYRAPQSDSLALTIAEALAPVSNFRLSVWHYGSDPFGRNSEVRHTWSSDDARPLREALTLVGDPNGGTPTPECLDALCGEVEHDQQPDERTLVISITDGEPDGANHIGVRTVAEYWADHDVAVIGVGVGGQTLKVMEEQYGEGNVIAFNGRWDDLATNIATVVGNALNV